MIENFTETLTIIALIIAVISITLLFLSKKLAIIVIKKRFPNINPEDKGYEEKLLNYSLFFKSVAAVLAVGACVLTLF